MQSLIRSMRLGRLATAAFASLLVAGAALADDDTVVATVNGHPITEADLALTEAELDQQFAQLSPEQRRAAALTAFVEIHLMAEQAEQAGLADAPDFDRRMELLRKRALHSAYIEAEIAGRITDEAVRERYEREIADIEAGTEVRARHIIVETREEAADIIAELDAGGDFEELAREHSTDGAAAQGGDLGYFSEGQMVPEFEQAAFAMEVGDYSSEPVETQFGWHVIELVDRRDQQPPPLDQVASQLRSLMLRELYFETVTGLREEAEIDIADPDLAESMQAIDQPAAPQ